MTIPSDPKQSAVARFRTKLLVAMMLLVSAATAIALLYAQRDMTDNVKRDLEREFHLQLSALHTIQGVRHAALAERCRALARKPRIHAALEDNALDLLYPSTRDELRDVMSGDEADVSESGAYAFHARFYRFLDAKGEVIAAREAEINAVGVLLPSEEKQLALPTLPKTPQSGYLTRQGSGDAGELDEVIAMPIFSTETNEVIAALVLGFKPVDVGEAGPGSGIRSGIWVDGKLNLPGLGLSAQRELADKIARAQPGASAGENNFNVEVDGAPYLLFYNRLNAGSAFPPAYEVCIYPLTDALARQLRLFWQFVGTGVLVLVGAFVVSHFLAARLAGPVEKLAVDSDKNRAQWRKAEAALELTHEELQRSARFSADASHQLKTPVTVLRAGLEELLADEKLAADVREEVSGLVYQTFRLTSVIEDLLLLSRMDAGRLKLVFGAVDLTHLIDAWLDDLGALPDGLELAVETDVPAAMLIEGEKRYTTLILQNLLENARKYNRARGRIRIVGRREESRGVLTIGNSGSPIAPEAQAHIFERFHRGSAGENVAGHGLGLNLARELARLHRGDLRLVRSESDWTEFEVTFRLASGGRVEPGLSS